MNIIEENGMDRDELTREHHPLKGLNMKDVEVTITSYNNGTKTETKKRL